MGEPRPAETRPSDFQRLQPETVFRVLDAVPAASAGALSSRDIHAAVGVGSVGTTKIALRVLVEMGAVSFDGPDLRRLYWRTGTELRQTTLDEDELNIAAIEIIRDAEACPRLSAEEQQYISNLRWMMTHFEYRFRLSARQWEKLRQIEDRVYA